MLEMEASTSINGPQLLKQDVPPDLLSLTSFRKYLSKVFPINISMKHEIHFAITGSKGNIFKVEHLWCVSQRCVVAIQFVEVDLFH